MRAEMRRYFQVSKTEIEVLNLDELECGIDSEVVVDYFAVMTSPIRT